MTSRAELFLCIIAVATLTTSILQIGVLVAAGLLARRIQRLVDHIDQELKPIFEQVQSIARDAARAASLATAQVERIDRAVNDLVQRLDRILTLAQNFLTGPMKKGEALFTSFRAVFNLIRNLRNGRSRSRAEDEDALFI